MAMLISRFEDQQAVGRIVQTGQQLHRTGQRLRGRQWQVVAEDHLHAVIQDQDQRKGRQHLRQVVTHVERAKQAKLERHAEQSGQDHRADDTEHEGAAQRHQPGRQERAHHIQRTVRQVDHVHDAEDQRQAGRQQEQHQAELQPVEQLLDNEKACHAQTCVLSSSSCSPARRRRHGRAG
jgi:hypothetical protein